MTLDAVPPRFASHPGPQVLDDAGVPFRGDAGKLYAMNTTSTFIWCLLEEGHALAALAPSLQKRFGLSAAEAGTCIAAALRQWHGLGSFDPRFRLCGRSLAARDASSDDLAPLKLPADANDVVPPKSAEPTTRREKSRAVLAAEGV